MRKLRLSGRKAALVGVTAAAATAATVAVAAPALAAPSQLTSCTDTVRVRSQPSASAPVIGSCQSGEKVTVDDTRNGFAHVVNKKGWVSLSYVKLRGSNDNDRYRDDNRDNDRYSNDNDRDSNNDDNNDYDNDRYNNRYDKDDHDHDSGLLGGLGG